MAVFSVVFGHLSKAPISKPSILSFSVLGSGSVQTHNPRISLADAMGMCTQEGLRNYSWPSSMWSFGHLSRVSANGPIFVFPSGACLSLMKWPRGMSKVQLLCCCWAMREMSSFVWKSVRSQCSETMKQAICVYERIRSFVCYYRIE